MRYKSISTAPHDGVILVFIPYRGIGKGRVKKAFWGSDIDNWKDAAFNKPFSVQPTHWLLKMPRDPVSPAPLLKSKPKTY